MRRYLGAGALAGMVLAASAVAGPAVAGSAGAETSRRGGEAARLQPTELNGAFDLSWWQRSNGWSNGDFMGCTWNAHNVVQKDGQLALSITDDRIARKSLSCAELRSYRAYGFGAYTVDLKAVRADGVLTSVSHYTGPSFGDPWNEILFGINGKDTTRLEVGWVVDGRGHYGTVIDLGFDAAEGIHSYGFQWRGDRIVWTVDGRPVHSVSGGPREIPQKPGRIYLRFWNGAGETAWMSRFQYPGRPLTAVFAAMRHEKDGDRQEAGRQETRRQTSAALGD
ncbi:family 16 glycosylhydrolase [Azospirillum thermophilum]|uniref:Beta-glucanase n=1 Tax=Azospirillum thermophilum TaxID=2202148 RepID=A0A2S2CMM2_9PROT|nr:family 16 glycosylhydrolase [Azospirillum thermophilum]AWK85557.1 beta-glucanase [Azospirillum thermophilum]